MAKHLQVFDLKKNTFRIMGKGYKEAVHKNAKMFSLASNISFKLKCNIIIPQQNWKYLKMISRRLR